MAIGLTFVVEGVAAIVIGDGEFRIELDCLIVIRDRASKSCFW